MKCKEVVMPHSQDEQIGWLASKVDSLQYELTEFKEAHKDHVRQEDVDRGEILAALRRTDAKLDGIEDRQRELVYELTLYKRVLKTVGALLLAIVTVSYNDIVKVFKGL